MGVARSGLLAPALSQELLKTNVSVKSKLQQPHPPGHTPGTPRAFDTFAVPGRREFDYQSLPGGILIPMR